MKRLRSYPSFVIALGAFFLVLAGCGGGGGGGGGVVASAPATTIDGKVADGYVSNASVYVYSDAAMATQIGAGSTDSNGNFSITLDVSSVPDPLYLKSVGGTDVDTGLTAPTMLFVGSGSSGTFNITPLTDCLYRYFLTLGLDAATQYLTGQLSISSADLYGDPVENPDLNDALYRVLSSGTTGGTLPDGNYLVAVIYLEQGDVGEDLVDIEAKNYVEMNVTISGGVVDGNVAVTGDVVTGKVQGSSIVLTIVDDPDEPEWLTRVTGGIGLMGSVAGIYTKCTKIVDGEEITYEFTKGVFIASSIPASGLDPDGVADVISSIYNGQRHLIYRVIFGGDHKLAWGDLDITYNYETGIVTAPNTTVKIDNGSAAPPTVVPLDFQSGELLETSGGDPANIIKLEFDVGGDTVFFMQPVGSRRGIFMVVDAGGSIDAIGDAYMAREGSLAPSLESDIDYDITVAAAHAGMIDSPRDDWIIGMPGSDTFTMPDFSASDYAITDDLLMVFNGSLMAFKNDDLNDGLDVDEDFIRMVELFETGAFQGEEIVGGYVDFPATFVGFLKEEGESAPSVTGTLNFLARALYATDYSTYENAYITGTCAISGSSATLAWTHAGGDSGTATLALENNDGLYHMHGNIDISAYLDIFWPVGGKKAVYLTSNWDGGAWVTKEVGEAYLTY